MIVYRVADGKGWTKDTFAQVTTHPASGNPAQLGHLSTLRVAQSDTAFTTDDPTKSVRPDVEASPEASMMKESGG